MSAPKAEVDRSSKGYLRQSVHALHGIFWALDMLVVHRVADEVAHDEDLRNGIDQLILAGEMMTKDLGDRF